MAEDNIMKKIAQQNAFKADPMNRFAKDKPILFFALTVSIFYSVFFIASDIFLAVAEATSLPILIRLEITGRIMLMALGILFGIKLRWKKIEKIKQTKTSTLR